MSIELMSPDKEYPDAYHVRQNWCDCHPETCCCKDWAVHEPSGEKHSPYMERAKANEVAEALELVRSNADLSGWPAGKCFVRVGSFTS